MTDIADKSLLRCTYKKSLHVFEKVVLYTAYAIDGLAAIVIGFYAAFWAATAVLPTWQWILEQVCGVYNWVSSWVISLVSLVPWYVWAIIAGVLAIPVYSLLWCVSRELTEEDVNYSDPRIGFGVVAVLASALAFKFIIYCVTPTAITPVSKLVAFLFDCVFTASVVAVVCIAIVCILPIYHHYIIAPRKAKQETFAKVEMP